MNTEIFLCFMYSPPVLSYLQLHNREFWDVDIVEGKLVGLHYHVLYYGEYQVLVLTPLQELESVDIATIQKQTTDYFAMVIPDYPEYAINATLN